MSKKNTKNEDAERAAAKPENAPEATATDETPKASESEAPPAENEPVVKTGFDKISIRAMCDNGEPFTGSFRSLNFDAEGVADVTIADRESVEKLKDHFPTLEIKQA